MAHVVVLVLEVVGVVLLVPSLMLAVECLMAAIGRGPMSLPGGGDGIGPRLAVVVPAHDEQSTIGDTLHALISEVPQPNDILVVADNCTDDTANIARAHDVEVIERDDPLHLGKGYALDFAKQFLRGNPPEVVVLLDADCTISPGGVRVLATNARNRRRPVQCVYVMQHVGGAQTSLHRIADFAWLVRCHVRPQGLAVLGLPCQLAGTGMALPWESFESAHLASADIVEDIRLNIELVRTGDMPAFVPDASVTSYFPVDEQAIRAQRRRWEHGRMALTLRHGIPALIQSLARLNFARVVLALDICMPPLSMLVLGVFAIGTVLAIIYAITGLGGVGLLAAITSSAALLAAIGASWIRFGRSVVGLRDLLSVPGYAFGRLVIFIEFMTSRQKAWNRAKRQ